MLDALFSWTGLVIVVVALVLILVGLQVFGKNKLTFRFRGAVTVSPWAHNPCPHLGLLDEPFVHREEPDEEHRCYLWMQRDRIDPTHQKGFCLTSAHIQCPWLAITPPVANASIFGRWRTGVEAGAAYALSSLSDAVLDVLVALIVQLRLRKVLLEGKRRVDVALPFLAPLVVDIAEELGSRSALAAKIIGRIMYERSASAITHAARKSEAVAREALYTYPNPPVSFPRVAEPEPEVTVAPEPPIAAEQPVPTPTPSGIDASHIRNLIEQGKVAATSGNRKLAYNLFSMVIDLDPRNDEAWLWKGEMADSSQEKFSCLQRALTINPGNQRAWEAVQRMADETRAIPAEARDSVPDAATMQEASPRATVAGAPTSREEQLIATAIAAAERGDEEAAYDLFVQATKANSRSEKAWFWRAKVAPTLEEVIYSLQQALAINPGNEKIRANLVWATQRKQREQEAKEAERRRAVAAAEAAKARRREGRPTRSPTAMGFRWLAGMVCLALAAYWVSIAFLPLVEMPELQGVSEGIQATANIDLESARPLYDNATRWLPGFTWVSLPWYDRLEITPGYNLYTAVPYTIGFLYFFIAVGVLKRQTWSHFWGFVVTTISLGLGIIFSTNSQAALLLTTLGLATILMLFASRSEFRGEAG